MIYVHVIKIIKLKIIMKKKDCMQPKYLAPATSNSIKLARFFDKVKINLFHILSYKNFKIK